VYAPADASQTLITCSSGGILNETIQALATTCATSCTVKTLYDESGALACGGGGACDLQTATIADRPALTLSCLGAKYCMTFNGSNILTSIQQLTSTQAQPYTTSFVAKRTTDNGNSSVIAVDGPEQFGFRTTNNAFVYAGNVFLASATENTWHAVQGVLNGGPTTSTLYVDGSSTSGDAGTVSLPAASSLYFGSLGSPGTAALTGTIAEGGIWPSAFSAPNQSAMNSNQHSYWGF
jgi:hypothetical protein